MEKGIRKLDSLFAPRICFQIPVYQRNYSWGNKQLEDLWNDLYYLETDKAHYFGTIILMEREKRRVATGVKFDQYDIVDGQQRMTTTIILLSEILKQLETSCDITSDNLRKLNEDWLRYQSVYKLELLNDDKEFFRKHIIDRENSAPKAVTESQQRILDARVFFEKKFKEIAEKNLEESKSLPAQLLEKIEEMEVMVYPLKETAEAARMFELVNDRGKPLTGLEKTKSYLMYMIYLSVQQREQERYLRDLNYSFGNIYKWLVQIQDTDYGKGLTDDDIQRYHFITYAAKDMFASMAASRTEASYSYIPILKSAIISKYRSDKNKRQCINLIMGYTKDLENAFSVFTEIMAYKDDYNIKNALERIFLLGRAANFYPLLKASWMKYKDEKQKILEILRLIEVMTFRVYAIGKNRADIGRLALYDLAHKVNSGSFDFQQMISELKRLILEHEPDANFEIDLKVAKFYEKITGTDKRYLLYHYESHLRNIKREPLEFSLNEILSRDNNNKPRYEIEHIWPQADSKLGLDETRKKEHQENLDRLGNLTLAAKGWNASIGNNKFSDKCTAYRDSTLRVQTELVNYPTWGKAQIDDREKKLVKFALQKWQV